MFFRRRTTASASSHKPRSSVYGAAYVPPKHVIHPTVPPASTAPRTCPSNARRRPSAAHGRSSKPKKLSHSNAPDRGKKSAEREQRRSEERTERAGSVRARVAKHAFETGDREQHRDERVRPQDAEDDREQHRRRREARGRRAERVDAAAVVRIPERELVVLGDRDARGVFEQREVLRVAVIDHRARVPNPQRLRDDRERDEEREPPPRARRGVAKPRDHQPSARQYDRRGRHGGTFGFGTSVVGQRSRMPSSTERTTSLNRSSREVENDRTSSFSRS